MMNRMKDFFKGLTQFNTFGLLTLRVLPAYYMIVNHGWKKIINPERWEKLGNALTKYFGDILDFANPFFGFLASAGETVCALMVLIVLFTQPAALVTAGTMFFAAMHHITTTGSPESAWIYFSIFMAIAMLGPGKYSIDEMILKKK